MNRRWVLAVAAVAALAAASLPARGQSAGVVQPGGAQPQVRSGVVHSSSIHSNGAFFPGSPRHVFIPGFGLRPVIQERFPVFGLGFDAHHFNVLNRQHGFFPQSGFIGGGFFGRNFFAGGFFPLLGSTSTVVVVPQVVPVQVPVPVVVVQEALPAAREVVVPVGLPDDWGQVRIVKPSYPTERPPLAHLTLLVLKDETIRAVTDYWLEDGRIFFVTSTGAQNSVAVRDLDLEMTTRLNAERHVPFVLRSGR